MQKKKKFTKKICDRYVADVRKYYHEKKYKPAATVFPEIKTLLFRQGGVLVGCFAAPNICTDRDISRERTGGLHPTSEIFGHQVLFVGIIAGKSREGQAYNIIIR